MFNIGKSPLICFGKGERILIYIPIMCDFLVSIEFGVVYCFSTSILSPNIIIKANSPCEAIYH